YEVSDHELNSVISNLEAFTNDQLVDSVRQLVQRHSPDEVISRLRLKTTAVPQSNLTKLVMAITEIARVLPRPETFWFPATPFFQAAAFVGDLIRQASSNSRFELAERVMREGAFLPFVVECYRCLHTEPNDEQNRVFSDEQQQHLRAIIARRVRDH